MCIRDRKVSEPYKLANRAFHPDDTIVDVAGVKVGGDNLALIAGPCSVESKEQVIDCLLYTSISNTSKEDYTTNN